MSGRWYQRKELPPWAQLLVGVGALAIGVLVLRFDLGTNETTPYLLILVGVAGITLGALGARSTGPSGGRPEPADARAAAGLDPEPSTRRGSLFATVCLLLGAAGLGVGVPLLLLSDEPGGVAIVGCILGGALFLVGLREVLRGRRDRRRV